MKHIELASELTYSAHAGDVANKKRVLDDVMDTDALEGQPLQKAVLKSVSALNRLRRMFPDTNRSVRFHKISDFYTLAVLIQTFEAEGLVLTDRRRNKLAWDILVAFGTGLKSVGALNRLRRMFPDTNRSVRFHKISDFYTLAVLIQTFEAEGLVLTDRRRNKLAWDILVASSVCQN